MFEFKEPAGRHAHGLPDCRAVELVRLTERYANYSIKHARICAKTLGRVYESLSIRVYVAVLHLLKQCLESHLITRYVFPIDRFLLIDYPFYEPDPSLDDHEEASSTVTDSLLPF